MLSLDPGVLDATFAALRSCGGGVQECVVYWAGPTAEPTRVDRVLQPPHWATAHGYTVDSHSITDLFLDLRTARSSIKAQIHTHPGPFVEHSPTDDAFALAPSPGFYSVVLPHFATGPVTLDGCYATVVTDEGWEQAMPDEAIRWS